MADYYKEEADGCCGPGMLLLDIRQGRDLTGTLITDIVLELLFCVAQMEKEFIRQRQAGEILHVNHKTFLRWVHGTNVSDKRAIA